MSLANVTYQTLIDAVSTYLTTNCANVSNYANIPACFKSGYSTTTQISSGGYSAYAYCAISANAVTQVASSTVTSELTTFVNSLGITTSSYIDTNNFTNFFNNLVSYIISKTTLITSQFSANRYLIYLARANRTAFTKAGTDGCIYAKSINDVLTVLNTTINQVARSISVKYTYTFS